MNLHFIMQRQSISVVLLQTLLRAVDKVGWLSAWIIMFSLPMFSPNLIGPPMELAQGGLT